jgi:hypothetical protein
MPSQLGGGGRDFLRVDIRWHKEQVHGGGLCLFIPGGHALDVSVFYGTAQTSGEGNPPRPHAIQVRGPVMRQEAMHVTL